MKPELKPMHSNLMQEYILLNNALKYTTDKNVYKAIQDRLESIAIEFCFEKKRKSPWSLWILQTGINTIQYQNRIVIKALTTNNQSV